MENGDSTKGVPVESTKGVYIQRQRYREYIVLSQSFYSEERILSADSRILLE